MLQQQSKLWLPIRHDPAAGRTATPQLAGSAGASIIPGGAAARQLPGAHQKTGTSNMGKNVAAKPISSAFRLLHLQHKHAAVVGGRARRAGCRDASCGGTRTRRGVPPPPEPQQQRSTAHREGRRRPAAEGWGRGLTTHQNLNSGEAAHKGPELLVRLAGKRGALQLGVDLGAARRSQGGTCMPIGRRQGSLRLGRKGMGRCQGAEVHQSMAAGRRRTRLPQQQHPAAAPAHLMNPSSRLRL